MSLNSSPPHFGTSPNSLYYEGSSGNLYFNCTAPVIYGPKYGSQDTVGVGVTNKGDVYFTLNGVLLPLVETSF